MNLDEEPVRALLQRAWGTQLADLSSPLDALPEELVARAQRALSEDPTAEVGTALEALARWLWSRNQFLSLDDAARRTLSATLERALRGLARPGGAPAALALHRRELADFVRARLGPSPREVTCAEYSPALQLEVLGLAGIALTPPVLDVGCGPSAQLVRFLREGGLPAEGLDREAPADVGTRGDWLAFDYARAAWGAVLSHQGFTLHFLHHHHAPGDAAYAYAHAYMAILRALRTGGLFAYAPGLPFIEGMLESARYRVERVPFSEALRVPALVEIEARTGLSLSYAAHVTRVA